MKVLISGASGLIGSALIGALQARGDEVVTLVRPESDDRPGSHVAWDPSRRSINTSALDAVGAIDAVVHLAGAGIADKRWSSARKREIDDSRINGTSTLAAAAAEMASPPSVFLSGSAIGIYGSRGDEELDEASEPGTGFLAEVCEHWEQAARPVAEVGIRTVLLRTGIVLSPKGGALAKQLPIFKMGAGGRLGYGRQWTSWISITDEVNAIIALLGDLEISGPVNLTAPTPVTNADMTKAIGRVLHRPSSLAVPPFALRAALGRELVDEALLASQRVLPSKLLDGGFQFEHATIESALTDLLKT